jgi:lipoate-protein ligase A
MQSWRLLELEYADAPSNLAFEEALARQIGEGGSPPTLRLWRNRCAAVIGENQSASAELQLGACRRLGVQVVRRFTGGGAVYHDLGNLNYSICVRKPDALSLKFQSTIFTRALDCAVTCLRILGVESSRVPVNAAVVQGRKISGGAGAIRWGAILYHGSILVSTDLEMVWKVLTKEQRTATSARAYVQSKRAPVTSVKTELGKEISIDRVKEVLRDTFAETFDACLVRALATEQELRIASALTKEKYGTEAWNLKT